MNELPELVLIKILDHLPIDDQLNGRRVCKLWKQMIDDNSLIKSRKELILFYRVLKKPLIWHHNNQAANLDNSIIVNDKFKESQIFKSNFKCIKNLYLVTYEDIFFTKEELSDFIQNFVNLENLQIYYLNEVVDSQIPLEVDFNLNQLKTLYLGQDDRLHNLNCPNLTKLSIYDDCFVLAAKFNSTFENLKFLKLKSFTYLPGFKAPNLEVLYFSRKIHINLADFPKLNRIHYFYHKNTFYNETERELILNGLMEARRRAGRIELDIFYDGIRCKDDGESIKQVIEKTSSKLGSSFYYGNYDYYIENPDEFNFENVDKLLKYSDLFNEEVSFMEYDLVEDVSKCINTLYFGKSLTNQLINFTNWELFKYVKTLIIKQLAQEQLDRLPDCLPNLVDFMYPSDLDKKRVVNFEFLCRFKGLKCFSIQKGLVSLHEFRLVVDHCKYFYYGIFDPSIHYRCKNNRYLLRTTRFKEKFDFATKKTFFNFLEDKNLIFKVDPE